jgi:hypothetical protein
VVAFAECNEEFACLVSDDRDSGYFGVMILQ